MQIRLTVVDPQGPLSSATGRPAGRDVLVTAPAGTALDTVASALAAAVAGDTGTAPPERTGRERVDGRPGREAGPGPVFYAGAERLDARRCTLGEPPLLDGAVLSLGAPAEPEPHPALDEAPAQLHVVAGPDAGGVHLLHGGQIVVGRSADADVPLDDPDVSRMHCTITVLPDGRVTVADLGSTNGTVLDGKPVEAQPVRFGAGVLLRIGESALRLTPSAGPAARVATAPDGEGHLQLTGAAAKDAPGAPAPGAVPAPEHHRVPDAGASAPSGTAGDAGAHPGAGTAFTTGAAAHGSGGLFAPGRSPAPGTSFATGTGTAFGSHPTSSGTGTAPGMGTARGGTGPLVPAQGAADGAESHGFPDRTPAHDPRASAAAVPYDEAGPHPEADGGPQDTGGRKATPLRGTDAPQGLRRRGGLGAWARRLAGGRGSQARGTADDGASWDGPAPHAPGRVPAAGLPETWPDPAALLLAALGPGPRLWERGLDHPEVLTVRLGTADRPAPDGSGRLVPAVAVTAALREVGALGLAGPRARLAGLARAVLAQLAALHSPELLEIVLLSAGEDRPLRERTEEWSWLGWLPHVRPRHGQDCRLLLAFDAAQAAARTEELLRRLDDHPGDAREHASGGHRPSWARDDAPGAGRRPGSFTVVVVDGDPGDDAVRRALTRLTLHGPRAGIHVVCLAEAAPASPASPLTESYRAACAASAVFRECGAVALLSGDVATALRLMRVAPAGPGERMPLTPGTVAAVDAVSAAWAERFARALAPLRPAAGGRPARMCAPLPPTARLLDELGLARATPASLQARWADAADDAAAPGGRARAILGAGPHGPVAADLVADGPHLLVEGPSGSGRTELLRSVVASLAAAERPDRLSVVLVDGRDGTGAAGEPGEGLRVCTDVPHVTTHLSANDPVRMREFAQSLTAELKRRAELLGREDFAAWHTRRQLPGRIVAQRTASGRAPAVPVPDGSGTAEAGAAAGATLRLRPAAGQRTEQTPPLPRLVVVVDDLDALVAPALGAPGRPAAGSVVRALEAVARDGGRLGVHLVAAAVPGGRTAQSEPARRAALRITLDAPGSGPQQPGPGRGRLTGPDGTVTPFQGGRVTGRIPRTATQRPTVVPLQWERMGDPPARRTVRELGNGPTDLALLASALERAAGQVSAARVPSLL
ncbi:FHA domain-containing protein [Streptomyces thermodiastaticus]|uniref:FHA domain-containing protein n=1 Tax=Streptomyces thermodiastaticus TaxID=44061 RepID=UPI001676C514|nr:FHA domain-containing protein [Streptomyces thermodiastaticus]GHF93884.1 hypothetical protein GCM10018787_48490 [Streptomyces thermodiastaticus]